MQLVWDFGFSNRSFIFLFPSFFSWDCFVIFMLYSRLSLANYVS